MNTAISKFSKEIKDSIKQAADRPENRYENGAINWNFVDADVCIEYGTHFELIGSLLDEVADDMLKKIDFTEGMIKVEGGWVAA